MVKNIILHLDEEFFEKLKIDKFRRQAEYKCEMTWEVYIAILFGLIKRGGRMK
jgi:hypothetical protein